MIDEIDVQFGAGEFAFDSDEPPAVLAQWGVPANYLGRYTRTAARRLKIVQVLGRSMAPDFLPGDRVLVDFEDRTPSPSGVFLTWDGVGRVMKQLEVVPNSDPIRLLLKSRNPQFESYDRTMEEVTILGRVLGKWDWF